MLNKVMLIGRLGRDPELRYAANGTPICNFSIATDESYTDRDGQKVERTEWHNIVTFQRVAENCKTYLGKGSLVFVEGSLQTEKWQDKEGQDRYTTKIKAQRVQFLNKKEGQGGGQQQGQGSNRQAQYRQQDNDDMGPAFPSEASGMDDVPF
ncbi:MAG: single-stranded DNA-binding protein [Deltaproteobacteria bacterium]|jgi:single-strand DNA-binding protein|nr:single-stranded DNA-binding protein [Deltaproteobacteria bacterium]